MVEVYDHCLFLHLHDDAVEAVAVGVGQGNDIAGIDVFLVKASVNGEDLLVEFDDAAYRLLGIEVLFSQLGDYFFGVAIDCL